ncbi:hypothetical protein [Roseicyclus persicicus]|uniref:Uncharacterized protein n=1 Tax=Roseicyclus persicicus TaxID=2650661 RepID=A0A7X6GYG8_9RHOB|nr:hypothetical protein [Roseibacterium persicicum]NKX43601.1 hypothetical protein [Roseibacterium persicicum]
MARGAEIAGLEVRDIELYQPPQVVDSFEVLASFTLRIWPFKMRGCELARAENGKIVPWLPEDVFLLKAKVRDVLTHEILARFRDAGHDLKE